MSWAAKVQTDRTGNWYGNGLRFATQQEARTYASELEVRWTAVHSWMVEASADPVNSVWRDGKAVPVVVGDAHGPV